MKRKFNVLQLIPNLVSGGVERGTLEVSAALVEAGHGSHVISGGGRLVDELTEGGSHHTQWPIGKKSPFTIRYRKQLWQYIQSNQIDIVHARSRVPAWLAYLTLKRYGKRAKQKPIFMTTCHGLHSVSRFSGIMCKGSLTIAVSETVKTYLIDNYQIDAARISVVPRGVDPERFKYGYQPDENWIRTFESKFPQVKGAKTLLLAGRLTRLKGHLAFIDMFEKVHSQYDGQLVALFVGDEDPRRKKYAQQVRDKIKARNLEANILMTGHRSDIRELMSYCDITYAISQKPESFGRTVVEAISLGKPVLGYDHGGVRETLNTLLPEGLIPLHDMDRLNERTLAFLRKPPVITPENPYTLRRMLDGVLHSYEKAMQIDR